ncbi:hypothetical protein LIN78_10410 [Leeia sp. TBRC 13508]|uniref:DUF7793 domain-containing protein n=1 Tax=Leeia speluncae TaxID=2884804 RepID=A0ABS8D7J5_9NEIS|nr:hypothetical protein [Leeia speluncae]MCB6183956.1 hypothetical protein [Leeia speluncae]
MNPSEIPKLHIPEIIFREDGIVCVDHGYARTLTSEGVLEVLRIRREFSLKPMPLMIKMDGRPILDPKIISIVKSAEYCEVTPAVAYVTSSWYVRQLLDTYMTIQTPSYPLFVFEQEEEALAWLSRFVPAK